MSGVLSKETYGSSVRRVLAVVRHSHPHTWSSNRNCRLPFTHRQLEKCPWSKTTNHSPLTWSTYFGPQETALKQLQQTQTSPLTSHLWQREVFQDYTSLSPQFLPRQLHLRPTGAGKTTTLCISVLHGQEERSRTFRSDSRGLDPIRQNICHLRAPVVEVLRRGAVMAERPHRFLLLAAWGGLKAWREKKKSVDFKVPVSSFVFYV